MIWASGAAAERDPLVSKPSEAGAGELPMAEGLVWVCFAIAAAATVFVLMREPEAPVPPLRDMPLARYRLVALGASALATVVGVGRVVSRGAGPGLFGLAVLFNLVLASFWALRFLLVP